MPISGIKINGLSLSKPFDYTPFMFHWTFIIHNNVSTCGNGATVSIDDLKS